MTTPLHIHAKPFLNSRSRTVNSLRRFGPLGVSLGFSSALGDVDEPPQPRSARSQDRSVLARAAPAAKRVRAAARRFLCTELADRQLRPRATNPECVVVKEELRSLLARAGTNPERLVIRARLDSSYQHAAVTDAPEAYRLAGAIDPWWRSRRPFSRPAPTSVGGLVRPLAKHRGEHSVKP